MKCNNTIQTTSKYVLSTLMNLDTGTAEPTTNCDSGMLQAYLKTRTVYQTF